MANPTPKIDKTLQAATIVASLGEKAPAVQGSAQERMAELLARKLLREEEELEENIRIAKAARKAGAKAMQDKRDSELIFQENCPHMKPWGGPSIGGQRDHQQTYHFICLFCSKQWKNNELPAHLKIALDRVGGPDN